jgi:Immunity protein 74
MTVTNMTRGHINYQHGKRAVTIGGEMLFSAAGGADLVIYPRSIKNWNAPHDHQALTTQEREDVLNAVLCELKASGIAVEVDGDARVSPSPAAAAHSIAGGRQCQRSGYWAAPAKLGSRRYFFHGELLPDFDGTFGRVMWHWDADQDSPEAASRP